MTVFDVIAEGLPPLPRATAGEAVRVAMVLAEHTGRRQLCWGYDDETWGVHGSVLPPGWRFGHPWVEVHANGYVLGCVERDRHCKRTVIMEARTSC